MAYSKIEILGLRGFGKKQTLELGIPNSKLGSGLTVIVGANNSGKSTIYESFKSLYQHQPPSITEGRRNKIAGNIIKIEIITDDNRSLVLKTTQTNGSETEFISNGLKPNDLSFFTLPSRRSFSPFFNKNNAERNHYNLGSALPPIRGSQLDTFSSRLFRIQQNQDQFNAILSKVLEKIPSWYIEQADNGNYYLKFNYDGTFHNSDGSGEGLLSIFTIVDALYDSNPNDLIYIDEPELSLHPSLQRKLSKLLLEYSTDRQIVISTHSPYFINWMSIANGGKIARTVKEIKSTKIYQLKQSTASQISSLVNNLHNPHILGIDAREVFFLEDNIILVEGQEDVIFLNKILEIKEITLNGTFYGWGIGGAGNTDKVIQMLKDLGFKKIVVILDKNMKKMLVPLENQFPEYKFFIIPTNDIRAKKERKATPAIEGLIDYSGKKINSKHHEEIKTLSEDINLFFS